MLSRLKGIETMWPIRDPFLEALFRYAFPFEGN